MGLLNILIGNMAKGNNVLHSAHLRKHWNKDHYTGVRCFFNKKAHKKIRLQRRADKAAAVAPRPLGKLRPLVLGQTRRYASKVRIGRGFTLAELKQAGLTGAFAQTVGIAVDHRRHNKNAETMAANVKRLSEYKAKLILFPAKATAKKGLIPDSTADKVKAAEQNTTPSVFALPPVDKTSAPEPLTKEMLAVQVYRKLRAERTNARYEGKRIAKAKKAA